MRLKFVLALVFAFLPFCAHADDGVIKDIEFYEADIYELQDRFPYLAEIAKDQEKFVQEHPKARPLIIQTATITPGGSGRKYFVIRESSTLLCGRESCPLKAFDITDFKRPRLVLEVVVPPFVKIRDCPKRFSFLFPGNEDRWTSWVPGNQKFKPFTSYATLEEAAICDDAL